MEKNKLLTSIKGTEYYMAPEIIWNEKNSVETRQTYDGKCADIFSLGVLLFTLIFNQQPFKKASPGDYSYRNIYNSNFEAFWAKLNNKLSTFSLEDQNDIKQLIECLIAHDPAKRYTID